jgi:hypothetical protein
LQLTGAEISCLLVLVMSKQEDIRVRRQRRFLGAYERIAMEGLA